MDEQWMPIAGKPQFQVSSLGRIIGMRGHVLKTRLNPVGYELVNLGSACTAMVHRLVMAAFIGPCPEGSEVNHINGDKADNRLANLEYVTRAGNMQHAGRNGLLLQRRPKQFGDPRKHGAVRLKSGRWQAQISIGGRNRYLGSFATEDEAHAAFMAAQKERTD